MYNVIRDCGAENISSNNHSMFIKGADEKEILDIVKNENTDCNDIYMSLLKILKNI